jgi:hypothetical protein
MTGIVFVKRANDEDSESFKLRVQAAMPMVPPGRCLVATWFEPTGTLKKDPIESAVVGGVLGSPRHRASDSNYWTFFGNGAARLYRRRKLEHPHGTCFWVAFRSPGDKAYVRRHSLSKAEITKSQIDVKSPVFTRDVANNVWHLDDGPQCDRVLRRLQGLLSWRDETAMVLELDKVRNFKSRASNFDDDLVGVPEKEDYEWDPFRLFPRL